MTESCQVRALRSDCVAPFLILSFAHLLLKVYFTIVADENRSDSFLDDSSLAEPAFLSTQKHNFGQPVKADVEKDC